MLNSSNAPSSSSLKPTARLFLQMIRLCGKWKQKEDQKLNELEQLLRGKHQEYGEHAADKVVVFTQYSDTARYIYYQLRKRGFSNVDFATEEVIIHLKLLSVSLLSAMKLLVNTHLTNRHAYSSQRMCFPKATICKMHNVIVNYDLPWAIIRLIQRAGRVDRIGQKADKIYCYSFFPADGVEEIINLRGRLNDRINANANIVGSDEVFFEGTNRICAIYSTKNRVFLMMPTMEMSILLLRHIRFGVMLLKQTND